MTSRASGSGCKRPEPGHFRHFSRLAVTLILLCLSCMIFVARCHTRSEPLERDQSGYALVAHEMLNGRGLYTGVFDQKPPAIYATFAIAELAAGYTRSALFYLGVVTALVTLIGVYAAGSAGGGRIGGLAAALFWAVVCSDLALQANQPNAEVFMNACLIWAFALVARRQNQRLPWRDAVTVGLLYALATLYKQVTAPIPLLVMAVYALVPADTAGRRSALGVALIVIGTIAAIWASIAAFYALEGRFDAYYYATVTYNRAYSGSPLQNILISLGHHYLLPRHVWFALPAVGVILAAWTMGVRDRERRWLLFAAYIVGAQLAVALPGRFYAHYYQLWLPVLACGFGWAIATLSRLERSRIGTIARLAAAASLAICVVHEALFFRYSPVEWSIHKYGYEFVVADQVGRRLKSLLAPGEILYDASVEPELYLLTDTRPPSGIFYSEPLINRPRADQFTARLIRDLKRRPPDLVVAAYDVTGYGSLRPEVKRWIDTGYTPFYTRQLPDPIVSIYRFTVWARRGSPVADRLSTWKRGPRGL